MFRDSQITDLLSETAMRLCKSVNLFDWFKGDPGGTDKLPESHNKLW